MGRSATASTRSKRGSVVFILPFYRPPPFPKMTPNGSEPQAKRITRQAFAIDTAALVTAWSGLECGNSFAAFVSLQEPSWPRPRWRRGGNSFATLVSLLPLGLRHRRVSARPPNSPNRHQTKAAKELPHSRPPRQEHLLCDPLCCRGNINRLSAP